MPLHGPLATGHWVVEGIPLHRLEARVADQPLDVRSRQVRLRRAVRRVGRDELAAFDDGSVEVVRAVMERDLREPLAEHHPVRFDVVEVVKHEPRDRDRSQAVGARRSRQVRHFGVFRPEGERYEALEAARPVLQVAQPRHVIDAILRRLDVAVEHGRVRAEAGAVHLLGDVEPRVRSALVPADLLADVFGEYLGAAAGAAVEPGGDEPLDDLLVRRVRQALEVVDLDHRERLEVHGRELAL
jgi:hypothetical protein